VVEVMDVSTNDPGVDEAVRLFDIACSETDTISDLDACLTRLHAVRDAKAALTRLPAATLRAALEFRRDRGLRA
jgi:hypothetical protein